jgi:peptidyl-prolyl cis-trans isomerase SurA
MQCFKLKTVLLALTLVFAGVTQAQLDRDVVFTYQGNSVSSEEFIYQYLKNKRPGDSSITESDIRNYLDLYVKFKLKYQDARDANLDTLPDYITELGRYRSSLARNYLFDKEVTEDLIHEAYDRMKWEVRAAHILVFVDANATPADSLVAYNKIMAAYNAIQAGSSSFEDQVNAVSEDQSSKVNGGDLGFFTAMQLVYSFENEAYNTAVGGVSKVFRTQFGYHIVKVLDKRPNPGEIKIRHIMLRVGHKPEATEEAVRKNIQDIYASIQKGESAFDKMARSYSEDFNTKYEGGLTNYFSANQHVGDLDMQNWADMAFALQKDNDVSQPFRTKKGWHIVQRVQIRPIGTFDQMRSSLLKKIREDQRSQKSIDALVAKVKAESNYSFVEASFQDLLSSLDSNFRLGRFRKENLPKYAPTVKPAKPVRGNVFNAPMITGVPLIEQEIMRIGNEPLTAGDFADYIENKTTPVSGSNEVALRNLYNMWSSEMCVAYQDRHLPEKSPEFKYIYQEFAEGILMFNRKKIVVWDVANTDTAGLEKFFGQHREEYRWTDRYAADFYFCANKDLMGKVAKQVKKGVHPDTIRNMHNRVTPLSVDYKKGKYEKKDSYLFADKAMLGKLFANPANQKAGKIIKLGQFGDDFVVVKVNEYMPTQLKTLAESRGPVTARYEDYLEAQWVQELQQRYTVQVNEAVMADVVKRLTKK